MRNRKALIAIIAVAMLVLSPASLLAQEEEESIILGVGTDVVTWNSALHSDQGSWNGIRWLIRSLMELDPFTGEWIGDVAKDWEISEDGLTYTIYMHDNIPWSDGEMIDAYDVKFTYDATMSDLVETVRKGDFETIESVEVIDDFTVQFTFTEPSCSAFDPISFGILPAHKFAADFSDFMTNPFNEFPDVSAGPYILEEWVPDDYTAYVANPSYVETYPGVGSTPHIERLYQRLIVEDPVMVQALKAEEIDFASLVSAEQWDELVDEPHLDLFEVTNSTTVMFFAFNNADPTNPQPGLDEEGNPIDQGLHPIFGDPNVRKALIVGWDHQGAVDAIIAGHGVRVYSSIAPSIAWAYNSDLEPLPYDAEEAVRLLEEAGWVDTDGDGVLDKDGVPLSFTLNTLQGHSIWEPMTLLAQDDWREIGVDAQVNTVEWGTLVETLMGQEQDVTIIGFGGGSPDPDGISRLLFTPENDIPGAGFNFSSYNNPELTELLDEALYMPGCATEDRAPVYQHIQEILYEDAPIDFIYSPYGLRAMHQRVDGWDADAVWELFYNITDYTISAE
jgi:peptide/nickel transport system substrate-binding protein